MMKASIRVFWVLLFLTCAGCSWIPWYGKKEVCDLNKLRVEPVASATMTDLNITRGDGPAVEVELTDFDFGKVSDERLLHHDFRVRNTGKSVLKIKKVLPS